MRGVLPSAAGERAAYVVALSLGSFFGQLLSDIQTFFSSISGDVTSSINGPNRNGIWMFFLNTGSWFP